MNCFFDTAVWRRAGRALLGAALAAGLASAHSEALAGGAPLSPPPQGSGCASALAAPWCSLAPSLDGAAAIAVTADGRFAYAAAANPGAVTVLRRHPTSLALSPTSCIATVGAAGCTSGQGLAGATAVAVSPDEQLVAVAAPTADGVAVFRRNAQTGALTQPAGGAGCATETGSGGACLDGRALLGARDIAFSADGTKLYVAAPTSNAVSVLTVASSTGITGQPTGTAGCFSETGTSGQCGDGRSLYGVSGVAAVPGGVVAVAATSSSLVRLAAAAGTGNLSEPTGAAGCVRDVGISGCPDVRAMAGARDVAVSADGSTALVAAPGADAVATISLGAALSQGTGATGCASETGTSGQCLDARALAGVGAVAVGADGRTVYAASATADAVAVFDRSGAAMSQDPGLAGCAAVQGTPLCATASGLDGARELAVTTDGHVLVAAGDADAIVPLRPNRPPACEDVETTMPWSGPATITVRCIDPDGDATQLRLLGSPRGSVVALEEPGLRVTPRPGEATTLRLTFAASDGTSVSAAAAATVRIHEPPKPPIPPPVPPPGLPVELTGPLLGLERRMVDPRRASTTLTTFCLPRLTPSCAGTVALTGAGRPWPAVAATGPGSVVVALEPAARRALSRSGRLAAIAQLATPLGGWLSETGAPGPMAIDLPILRPRAGTRRTGTARADSLRGGVGDDRISGQASSDRLSGVGGDDRLDGGGGNDRLDGAEGHDRLRGSFGNDRLAGGAGDDDLQGASGDDLLRGEDDADRLDGGTGNDTVDGGAGDDYLDGFDGDDILRGGAGDDYLVESRFGDDILLDGGPGDDYVDGNRGNDQAVRGGLGNDIVLGGSGSDDLDGGPGNDLVDGGAGEDPAIRGGLGNDVLVGGRGNDRLYGGPGDDLVYGSTGFDDLDCGPGEDWVFVDSSTEGRASEGCEHVVATDPTREGAYDPAALVANRGLARGGPGGTRRGSALGDVRRPDRPIGTDGDDELVGDQERDHINGNDGDDLLTGLGGDDDLDGGNGADEIRGDDGNDRIFGRFGDDMLHGGAGDDELEGGRGRDTLLGGDGADRLNGGFDPDVLHGGPGNDRLTAVGGGVDYLDCGTGRDRADVDRGDLVRNCEDIRRH